MKLVIVDDDCLVSSSLKTILEAGGGKSRYPPPARTEPTL